MQTPVAFLRTYFLFSCFVRRRKVCKLVCRGIIMQFNRIYYGLFVSRFWDRSKAFRVKNRTLFSTGDSILKAKMTDPSAIKALTPSFVSVDMNGDQRKEKADDDGQRNIDFENHVDAFRGKSTWEIFRALAVLRMCSLNFFVENSLSIMKWTKRMLGTRGLRLLYKPMLYNQFVGGETHQEIQSCLRRLAKTGIRPMLAATMEEDIGDAEGGNDDIYDSNCSRIMECMAIATADQTPSPMMQLKMTGLLPADLVSALGELYSKSNNKLDLVKEMAQEMSADDYNQARWFYDTLGPKNAVQLKKALDRLKKIGQEAKIKRVRVLVDAEYTYLNPGLSLLTLVMAVIYNKETPAIWNTYQCYLKTAKEKLSEELLLTEQLNVHFGAKVVRGAYVVQERARSLKLGVEDPICSDYLATNLNYNEILDFLLKRVSTKNNRCTFIVASHNEESVLLALRRIKEFGIDKQNGGVTFGQLYGMCDQITFPLAFSGYAVYKSIPYGTVDEVLPYLSRRALENRSVLEGCRKEQALLWKEMKLRISRKIRCQGSADSQGPSS